MFAFQNKGHYNCLKRVPGGTLTRIYLWLRPILIKWASQKPARMSDWEKRPSTIKATDSLIERAKAREEIKKSKKISSDLNYLIQQEEAELDRSALELWSLSSNLGEDLEPQGYILETSSFDDIGAAAGPLNTDPEIPNLENINELEESDDSGYLDPLQAVKSPTKSPAKAVATWWRKFQSLRIQNLQALET